MLLLLLWLRKLGWRTEEVVEVARLIGIGTGGRRVEFSTKSAALRKSPIRREVAGAEVSVGPTSMARALRHVRKTDVRVALRCAPSWCWPPIFVWSWPPFWCIAAAGCGGQVRRKRLSLTVGKMPGRCVGRRKISSAAAASALTSRT